VKIARLYQQGGKQGETQILYAEGVAALFGAGAAPGLRRRAAGIRRDALHECILGGAVSRRELRGPVSAHDWMGRQHRGTPAGRHDGIRLAKSASTSGTADVETAGMATVADRLKKFCR